MLNVHLHMLVLDGVYVEAEEGWSFERVAPPTAAEVQQLVERIAHRVARYLEKAGWLRAETEAETTQAASPAEASINRLRGHSIVYRIALGPHAGKKAFTLPTLPAREAELGSPVAEASGFSLHAGVWVGANDKQGRERLCRYITRPAVSNERLELTDCGHVRYRLKTPWKDGATHVYLNPLDFMARLAALVPKPRVNLVRYHGVFASHHRLRAAITPAHRGMARAPALPPPAAAADTAAADTATATPSARHRATCTERSRSMSWAQRLKRVFELDLKRCPHCGGPLKLIASLDGWVMQKVLKHLEPNARGPPEEAVLMP